MPMTIFPNVDHLLLHITPSKLLFLTLFIAMTHLSLLNDVWLVFILKFYLGLGFNLSFRQPFSN